MLKKILEKYEYTLDEPKLGKRFDEVYDVRTIEPTAEWKGMYDKVKDDLAAMGIQYRF